jgi:predicted AlkP superfamily phosphohydrolase/phosphomutase
MNKPETDKYTVELYSEVASFIEFVMGLVEKKGGTLMVVSDHGAQPIKKEFLVNGWLIDSGYATLKKGVMNSVNKPKTDGKKATGLGYKMREMALNSGLRDVYDKSPYAVKKAVFKTLGNVLSSAGDPSDYVRILPSDFNMSETKAFGAVSVLPVSTVWINDSRFADGKVTASEKKGLIASIVKKMALIKDVDGKKLVVNVTYGSEYYKGVTTFIPPDIIFEVADNYTIDPYHFSKDSIFMDPSGPKNGDHLKNGIFGFYSQSRSCNSKEISVLDISGIVLDYFNLGVKSKRLGKI